MEILSDKLGGRMAFTELDWDALRAAAVEVARSAYAPYSHLNVGAAGVGWLFLRRHQRRATVMSGTLDPLTTGVVYCPALRRANGARLQRRERLVRARGVRRGHDGRAAAADRRRTARGRGVPIGHGQPAHTVRALRASDLRVRRPGLPGGFPRGPIPMREFLPEAFSPEHLPRLSLVLQP